MSISLLRHPRVPWFVFGLVFLVCLTIGGLLATAEPAAAAPAQQGSIPSTPETCALCHKDIVEMWKDTRHAAAFSSPIFQQDWTKLGSQTSCLACHTTGFDAATGKYLIEGVTCASCHGEMAAGHPKTPMSITPNAELCGTCHKTTTNEWMSSKHASAGITCQNCHDAHNKNKIKADSVTELCSNCHKEGGDTFAHGTHANAGLQCSNCHMYTKPLDQAPIEGIVPTGHTFSVGSDACIGCHQDTVHSRDAIVALSGEVAQLKTVDPEKLNQTIEAQKEEIDTLKSTSSVRLYTGLVQGAIIGLVTGAAAAWVVSKRMTFIEEE